METNPVSAERVRRLEAAVADLKALLGTCATTAEAQREHHSHGESYHAPALPDVVCFPRSTLEVSEIMKISARHQIPVIPFGAGTSVEGQVHALRGVNLRDHGDAECCADSPHATLTIAAPTAIGL